MAGRHQQRRVVPALALLLCALLATKLALAADAVTSVPAADKSALVTLSSLPVAAAAHARVLQQGGPDLLSPPAPADEGSREESSWEESSGEMSSEESSSETSNEESSGEESSSSSESNDNAGGRGAGAARKLLMRGL